MASRQRKSEKELNDPLENQRKARANTEPETLKGWAAIGAFLGLAPATAQRWARDGMPVHREGRFTTANRAELQAWLGRESNMPAPAQVVTTNTDLTEALKQSIKTAKPHRQNP